MGGFKLICSECGSDKIIEKNQRNKLFWLRGPVKYGEGIQRKCLDCDNESFVIYKTWSQEKIENPKDKSLEWLE